MIKKLHHVLVGKRTAHCWFDSVQKYCLKTYLWNLRDCKKMCNLHPHYKIPCILIYHAKEAATFSTVISSASSVSR